MQTAFNGGELSRFMRGRPDHEIWAVALAECIGFAPRPQGPLEACPGFEFVGTSLGAGRLIPFEPRVTQGYVVEATDALFRFYTNDVLLTDEGSAVSLATPYPQADLAALDYEQSEDVMYLWHRGHQSRQLIRTDAAEFDLQAIQFENGPFGDRNSDESHTLAFGGVSGTVSISSSEDLFQASDVGRLIEVEANDLGDVPSWEPGITTTIGAVLQWDGRVYQVIGGRALTGGGYRTGTVQPFHTRGVEWDGLGAGDDLNENEAGGVQLRYLHDMFGRVRITAVTDAQNATGTVTRRLPLQTASSYELGDYAEGYWTEDGTFDPAASWNNPGGTTLSAGTWRWRLGAFSDTTGWPEHGVVWNQRLYLFKDNVIYASVAGALLDFDRLNEFGEISLDQAFTLVLDDPETIAWAEAEDELFFGTAKSEWVLRQSSTSQGIGPGNVQLRRQTREGAAANVKPLPFNGTPIFLQRSCRAVLQMVESNVGRYETLDLTRYADHIAESGVVELAWQKRPLRLIWAVLGNGELACATYFQSEGVLGWSRRPLAAGLFAESICTITDTDGRDEQLWLLARDEFSGSRFVMLMDKWRRVNDPIGNPIMCDAGLRAESETPFSTISLPHLPNTEVQVVAGGEWLKSMTTDADGVIELEEPVTSAMAGLPFAARFSFLEPEGGGDNGPAQFKSKRVLRTAMRFEQSRGLQVVDQSGNVTKIWQQAAGDNIGEAPEPLSEDVVLDMIGAWERSGQIAVERYAPFQTTVLAAMHTVEVSQR